MIAKGASRSGPRQLAVYLMRVERWDTGEPAELLELLSPWAAGLDGGDRHHTADQLIEAFRDWQTLVEGTKQGRDGLYHAEISPEAHYARDMTPEQWKRAAAILGEELGLGGQPRALVLHAGKDDRPHLHVVWCRTDVDKMKVVSDSYNYIAHERASHRMELEFGHQIIPGKHAKRDRKKQEEFPRQKLTQDEDQYQKRTGLSKEDRIKEIAALHAAADNGPAFKAALEDAGYILAKGERGYIVVDEKGGHSVLSRNVGLKKKEIEAFMKGVDFKELPTVEEARDIQAERRKTVSKSIAPSEAQQQGAEASKFLPPQTAENAPDRPAASQGTEAEGSNKTRQDRKPEPVDPARKQQIVALRAWADGAQAFKKALEEEGYTLARGSTGFVLFSQEGVFSLVRHAGLSKAKLDAFMSPIALESLPTIDELIEARKSERQQSKFFPAEPETPPPSLLPAKETDLATRMEISALDMAAEAVAEAQRAREKSDIEALKKAIARRQQEEAVTLRERHEAELRAMEVELDRERAAKLALRQADDLQALNAFKETMRERRSGIKGIWEALEDRWNPQLRAERAHQRRREIAQLRRRQAKERADWLALLDQTKQLEIENLKERQALRMLDQQRKWQAEEERYIREHEEAKKIRAQIEAEEKELEKNESLRDGPPPPKLGK